MNAALLRTAQAATLPVPKSGLDFAQLEADRLAREEAEQVDAEEDLEAAFTAEPPPEVKKKSREELLADLAVQHAAKRAEGDLAKSKFKRVGEKKAVPSTAVTADGKKLRKKKRKVEEAPKVEPVASTSKAPSPPPLPLSVAPVIAEDDDVDIFADAGEYKAFDDSDSGDDAVPKPPKPAITTAHPIATTLPANLFGDDDEEIKADPLSVPSLKPRKATPPEAYGSDEDDDRTGGKLRGFADGTDIQEILALDKAAEREEKRKERKEKRQAEALEHGGVLPVEPKKKKAKSDKDRMNEEWQEYENYVRKKGGVEAQE